VTFPLTGTWSSENTGLYYPAFEDVTLALAADGTGRVTFSRPGYSDSARLTWRTPGDGTVELSYHEGREVSADGEAASDFSGEPTRVSYRIAEEDTPFLGRVAILRIDPPIMRHRAFGLK
jgi:hypothetical protein